MFYMYVFDRVENIVGKGENAFPLFPQGFLQLSFWGSLAIEIIDSKPSLIYWNHWKKRRKPRNFPFGQTQSMPLTFLPITFLPMVFLSLWLWHFYLWQFYLWHFYLWQFYLWHFYRTPFASALNLNKPEMFSWVKVSNFSFSHSVFKGLKLQTRKNRGLFGKGLNYKQTCPQTTSFV